MYININEKMRKQGISRYQLAKQLNITYPTMTAIYNGSITSIKLDTLEKLCQILKCTPNDILSSPVIEDRINVKQDTPWDFMNPPE